LFEISHADLCFLRKRGFHALWVLRPTYRPFSVEKRTLP
jgi:hypothetical protein